MSGAAAHGGGGPVSLQEFERIPEDEAYRVELVRGHLVREPAPAQLHARVVVRLASRMNGFAETAGVGDVLANCGFVLSTDPPTVRVPDIAFVARERIPPTGYAGSFWQLAPDLAIEVVSPSNTASQIHEKVLDYLDAGTRMVWVLDPATRTGAVYRSRDEVRLLSAAEALDGFDVLPEFRLALAELYSI